MITRRHVDWKTRPGVWLVRSALSDAAFARLCAMAPDKYGSPYDWERLP